MSQPNWENKDKRISALAIFKSLCEVRGGSSQFNSKAVLDEATQLTDMLFETYPSAPNEAGSEMPKYAQPFETSVAQTPDQYRPKEGDTCPECNQGILTNKSGVSKKTGKAYSFTACNNFPACKYVPK